MEANEIVSQNDVDHSEENVTEPIILDPDNVKVIIKKNPKVKEEFQELLSDCKITCRQVHEKAKVYSNGDIHIFYRYFFSKCISIVQRKCGGTENSILEKHASIFPFKTDPNLSTTLLPVAELFDVTFLKKVNDFVEYHFCDDFNFEHLKNLFLANIDHFKKEHFRNSPSPKQLTRIIGIGSNTWREDSAPEYLSDYLNDFIHLSQDGIEWFKYFQTKFNETCKLYDRKLFILPEKSDSYFKYLPEINCSELLLLLETDFYQFNRTNYTHLFKKYLFFFGHCIKRAEPNVVFFIDETLFSCLQFKKDYETFQGDIFDIEWELWMMTLVNRRKYPIPRSLNIFLRLDRQNLKHVINYIHQIPGIESASLYHSEPQHPRLEIFFLLDDVIFVVGYNSSKNTECSTGQILKSALLSREIRKIVYYNPCLGEETSFELPPKKLEILNFIRKYNVLDPVYPQRFLIKGLKKYFVNIPDIARQCHFDLA